jgi:hypothetical protein
MTIYSQDDFDSLKTALLSLLGGAKVIQASIGGKFVRYQDSQIPELKKTLNAIAQELGTVPSRGYAKGKGRFD